MNGMLYLLYRTHLDLYTLINVSSTFIDHCGDCVDAGSEMDMAWPCTEIVYEGAPGTTNKKEY
jgi:hypothetical protein